MVVEDIHATHAQAGPQAIEVNLDGIVPHRDHPKHVVAINVHVVIVNLISKLGRSSRTGVQVKSNKGERALMAAAVRTDESALAEAHIGLECQRRRSARRGVCSRPAAADVR